VDESALPGEDAVAQACRLAAAKAGAVQAVHPDRWVLGADTIVEIDGRCLGKPRDADDARAMIASLLGHTHRVVTAFALRGPEAYARDRVVSTEVDMRTASTEEIEGYLRAGEWRGKAGAYAVQGMAAALVTGVRGSITNVIGLPLTEVIEELTRAGLEGPRYQRGAPA